MCFNEPQFTNMIWPLSGWCLGRGSLEGGPEQMGGLDYVKSTQSSCVGTIITKLQTVSKTSMLPYRRNNWE